MIVLSHLSMLGALPLWPWYAGYPCESSLCADHHDMLVMLVNQIYVLKKVCDRLDHSLAPLLLLWYTNWVSVCLSQSVAWWALAVLFYWGNINTFSLSICILKTLPWSVFQGTQLCKMKLGRRTEHTQLYICNGFGMSDHKCRPKVYIHSNTAWAR